MLSVSFFWESVRIYFKRGLDILPGCSYCSLSMYKKGTRPLLYSELDSQNLFNFTTSIQIINGLPSYVSNIRKL